MLPVEIDPEAIQELEDAFDWYEGQRLGLGEAFMTEYEICLADIRNAPDTWAIVENGIRRLKLHRFPYGILYKHYSDRIHVLSVMHLHRNPRYWRDRL